jgi:hypothetical protein
MRSAVAGRLTVCRDEDVTWVAETGCSGPVGVLAVTLPLGHEAVPLDPFLPHLWEHILLGDPQTGVMKDIDELGGFVDGFVDAETMGFILAAPPDRLVVAARILDGGLSFPEAEPPFYRREVEAVTEELAHAAGSPSFRLGCAMSGLVRPGRSPGLALLDGADRLRRLGYDEVRERFVQAYDPSRLVVAALAAGDEALGSAQAVRLGRLPRPSAGRSRPPAAALRPTTGGLKVRARPVVERASAGAHVFPLGPAAGPATATLVRAADALLARGPRALARPGWRAAFGPRSRVRSSVVEHSQESFYALEWYALSPVDAETAGTWTRTLIDVALGSLDKATTEDAARAIRRARERTRRGLADPLRRALLLANRARAGLPAEKLNLAQLTRDLGDLEPEEVLEFTRTLLTREHPIAFV